MDTQRHLRLVAVIKGVHDHLRKSLKKCDGNYELVWQTHLLDETLRQQYSQAMLELATHKWTMSGADSRIYWCYEIIFEYFYAGGLEHSHVREMKCLLRDSPTVYNCKDFERDLETGILAMYESEKLMLLDVGSCYNPFRAFKEFDTYALDLTPATDDVFACDFLQLEIGEGPLPSRVSPVPPLKQLPPDSFHIIVFSLVLEYLPAPELRLKFCQKARGLLKDRGLLLVITPDSKSQNYNAPMVRSWKLVLEKLGFHRVRYEKRTHLHCMAYCKTSHKTLQCSSRNFRQLSQLIYIPQDFKVYDEKVVPTDRSAAEDREIQRTFSELPMSDS